MYISLYFIPKFITKSLYFCVGSKFILHPHTFAWGESSLFFSSSYFCVGDGFILHIHTLRGGTTSYFILVLLRGKKVHYFFHPHTFAWGTSSYFMFCVVGQLHTSSSYFCVGYILSAFSSSNFCVEQSFIFVFIEL